MKKARRALALAMMLMLLLTVAVSNLTSAKAEETFDVTLNAGDSLYMPYGMGADGTIVGLYAGGGYGAHITFPYEAAEAATYTLKLNQAFGVAQQIPGKGETIYLSVYDNGNFVKELSFPMTGDWGVFAEIPFELDLTAGKHYITFWHENTDSCGGPNVDYLDVQLGEATIRLEAEEVGAYQNGGMGGQPLGGFYSNRLAAAMFTIENVPADGYYALELTFQNGNPEAGGNDAKLAMLVNGQYVQDTYLADQDNWGINATQTEYVYLKAGTNTVRYWRFDMTLPDPLKPDEGGAKAAPNLVSLNVTPAFYQSINAENALYMPYGMGADGTIVGLYAGGGYGAHITFPYEAAEAGTYTLKLNQAFGVAQQIPGKGETIYLSVYDNGNFVKELSFPVTGDWGAFAEIPFELDLTAGKHYITFWHENTDSCGGPNVDYLDVQLGEATTRLEAEEVGAYQDGGMGGQPLGGFYSNRLAAAMFTIENVPADGYYALELTFQNGNPEAGGNDAKLAMLVNGQYVQDTYLADQDNWGINATQTEYVYLTAGTNTVRYWRFDMTLPDPLKPDEGGAKAAPNLVSLSVAPSDHIPGATVIENTVGATCGVAGSYDEVVYCTECNEELTRHTVTIPATGAHNWNEGEVTTAPTCTNEGVKTFTCVACGATKTEAVAAIGEHTYDNDCDADCNNCGETREAGHQYFYPCDPVCMICYEITNPDAAHNIVAVEAKAATCTEDGNVAYWYCSDCGTAWTDEAQTQLTNLRNVVIPATGEHTYDNDSDADCNVCGATREVGPTADANLKFMQSPSLSFQDYIGMQVLMTKKLAGNYDKVYVVAVQVTPEGEVTTTLNPITYLTNYYVFDQQIMAWSMTETVTLTLYAEKDGITYMGQTYTQSVESLALAMMEKYSTNTTICRMLVDMLNYGAAVQTQFSHNAENLPNTQLGDFAAMGSTNIPECDAANTKTGTATVKILNDSVSMQAKVEIQLVIKGAVTATPKATIGTTVLNPVLDTTSLPGYTVIRVAVGATQLRETVTIALYDENDAPVTQVYNVSVEGYAVTAITGSQKDVVIAMMRYGDSVTAYANK